MWMLNKVFRPDLIAENASSNIETNRTMICEKATQATILFNIREGVEKFLAIGKRKYRKIS